MLTFTGQMNGVPTLLTANRKRTGAPSRRTGGETARHEVRFVALLAHAGVGRDRPGVVGAGVSLNHSLPADGLRSWMAVSSRLASISPWVNSASE